MQSWPALKNAAPATASAVSTGSASAKTTTGALPPSSRWTRVRRSAPSPATARPARVLPVSNTMATVVLPAARAGAHFHTAIING